MTFKEWLKKKIFGTQGLADSQQDPNDGRYMLVNDMDQIQKMRIKEYNLWYVGDGDKLLNFYTKNNMVDYNYEPYFDRNKQGYYWAVSSTEGDIKRTHSGMPRNIVDTLVNIVALPKITVSNPGENDKLNDTLQRILKDNHFNRMFLQEQLPLTLVEGWGCWKINYDTELRDTPILLYYRAEACEFIFKSNQLVAVVFKDYYFDEDGKKYLLLETRRLAKDKIDGKSCTSLYIEKELFQYGEYDSLVPIKLTELPQLEDTAPIIKISNYKGFLAVPCVIYKDSECENQGRSIFTGKIDLFDDLDQCLSQSANTVRRSTAREYFNSNYLERDPNTGMPIMPTAFDRKYVMFQGGRDANGSVGLSEPVQTTQPALNFSQYDMEAQNILITIMNGIMSPATLGIDIAKKDNAEAQREKEKVTIFTRNTIIAEETEILTELARELMCASELMHRGMITARDYSITVKFNEFADASWEAKLDTLLTAFNAEIITPELFLDKLWGEQLSKEDKEKELNYIKERQNVMTQAMTGMQQGGPMPPAAMGGFGEMGADNAFNELNAILGPAAGPTR